MAESGINTQPQKLPEAASEAWLAYTNMLASKQAHFNFLETLEQKYDSGGKRSLAEISYVEGLLETHNQRVKSFAEAQKSLFQKNPDAHQIFIAILSDTNQHLGTPMDRQ